MRSTPVFHTQGVNYTWQMIPEPAPPRHELEEIWRERLEGARRRYRAATERYRRLLAHSPEGLPPTPGSALSLAREAESEALAEFTHALEVFTELTVRHKEPEEQPAPNLVTVVDDDESIRDSVRALLRSAGYRVAAFESAEAFLASGAGTETGCLILDFWMPGMSGLDLQVRLNNSKSRVPVIFITAYDEGLFRERAMEAGAVDILHKPFAPAMLLSTLRMALGSGGKEDA